jgi:nicotinamidase-related amidase
VVVDCSVGFTDPGSPLACEADDAVSKIAELLAAARAAEIPVVFTNVVVGPAEREAARSFLAKMPALLTLEPGSRWVEIDDRLAPGSDEPVLTKIFPSAFAGTPMAAILAARQCDTLIVTGASTSGCVRATVVDAVSHGYHVVVPADAVADRNRSAHDANLYDIDAKYGDVVTTTWVLDYLKELHATHTR